MGTFDASDASSTEPGAGELLRTMAADDSEQRMLAFLDELDELIEEDREREREEGLDPSVAALLESITGADDAPLEFRSLNRRVAEGVTSWEEFWVAPEETPGAPWPLISAARNRFCAVLIGCDTAYAPCDPRLLLARISSMPRRA